MKETNNNKFEQKVIDPLFWIFVNTLRLTNYDKTNHGSSMYPTGLREQKLFYPLSPKCILLTHSCLYRHQKLEYGKHFGDI